MYNADCLFVFCMGHCPAFIRLVSSWLWYGSYLLWQQSLSLLAVMPFFACARLVCLLCYSVMGVDLISITGLDHLVITVRDVDATCAFYRDVLGMQVQTFGDGRLALKFGQQKINIHEAARLIPRRIGLRPARLTCVCLWRIRGTMWFSRFMSIMPTI